MAEIYGWGSKKYKSDALDGLELSVEFLKEIAGGEGVNFDIDIEDPDVEDVTMEDVERAW